MSKTLSESKQAETKQGLDIKGKLSSSLAVNEQPRIQQLVPKGVIGFNGSVPNGFILHPDDKHVIYPLGSCIVVRHLTKHTQRFLQKDGHDQTISALAISPSGKYVASGQIAHMGFQALVIIWDLQSGEVVHKLRLHKGKVEDLSFSPNELYLASLGGQDDNRLIVWDVKTGEPICGSPAANETSHCVRFFNTTDTQLVTAGKYNLRVWNFDRENRKVRPTDCALGQLKRIFHSVVLDATDTMMYCGTHTGDLLQVSLQHKIFKKSGPGKRSFSLGVTSVTRTNDGKILVGTGDGLVALVDTETMAPVRKLQLDGGVTSLRLNAAGDHFFAATAHGNTYCVHLASFEFELRSTCHSGHINDIAFPHQYSQLFATASKGDIRVWNAETRTELLRIQLPNLECLCVAFARDGKSILSGWDDGKIRAFYPQSGKLMYAINDAHHGGVTSITGTADSKRVISGGQEGCVRVWAIEAKTQKMLASMKEHKGPVKSIQVNGDDSECVSASVDGSCIIWSLQRFVRSNCVFASTQFKSVRYHPDESQLLTTGTDRKITYWDVVDANPIRIMEGSDAEIDALDISADGEVFVSGGQDKVLKVWSYDEGACFQRGVGHSSGISAVRVSPNQQFIVSVGEEGGIFVWPYTGAGASQASPKK